ncbi:MAG: carboxypeptidase regulatory-like domain-containing protein [Actinomycetota bacterium]
MMSAIYRIRRRASGHAQDEAGFTMVEMVIAIFIFAMVITGVGVGMSSALNLTRQNRNRSIAANLAAQQMDTVRSTDFATLDQLTQLVQPTTVTPTPTVEGVPYTMTQNTRWIRKNATGAAAGPCQSPPTAANPLAYIAVTNTVTWSGMRGVLPVQTNTVISPPVGVYDQTEGHMRVTVLDAAGQPVSGALVSISNPGQGVSDNATTGTDGCVFFAYQPTGAYTVTLSSGVGKVDGQGSATPVQSVTVKSASTSTVQFLFDSASSLALTLSPITAGYTVQTTGPVSLGNTSLQPSGKLSYATPTGSPRTIASLFPYASGFSAWAGSCSDADPQGVNTVGAPYYPGAVRDSVIAMTPGGTSVGIVTVPSTSLRFKRTNSGSATYTIVALHGSGDAGCPVAESYTLTSSLVLVQNVTQAVNVSLPYGTWIIQVKIGVSLRVTCPSLVLSPSPVNTVWPVTPAICQFSS